MQVMVSVVQFSAMIRIALLTTLLLVLLHFVTAFSTLAEEASDTPLQISLTVDRTAVKRNQSVDAHLLLRNTRPYSVTGISVSHIGESWSVIESSDVPDQLQAFKSSEIAYTLEPTKLGTNNIVFTVMYTWTEGEPSVERQWIEEAIAEEIQVEEVLGLSLPEYLLPLLIGFLLSQFGTWLTYKWKAREEEGQQEEQAIGVALAMLQASRQALLEGEEAPVEVWEDSIVKGNLYPSLHQLGRTASKPGLSRELTELFVALRHYNRRDRTALPTGFQSALLDRVEAVIQTLENIEPAR